jgi:ethanolamine utilization protein EutQ (cupin superfamily)
MATTTNYSWTTPNDTDLVKDGASAIRTLGSAIDTTVYGVATKSTINTQTGTTYTLVLADAGKLITLDNGSAITLTVPTNATVAFATGTRIDLAQLGAGQVTVAGAGVTFNSKGSKLKITGQYSAATLIKIATDTWVLIGDLSA